ncbi:acyltransferase family protein [Marinobacter sp. MDS2]|uniref:acyltransferase family protein n=1 Tax=Marinobacter sp. MDS2 TaxID=3065961 RepID=UPI00273B203B|nr:acyltransferase family protein [Marinobacter sp. MDS2]MDP4547780.1 acyltransferase family protein [Marinobacter sp. MDS2]
MQYRREIDGLRAIAVLPVILFHAGFSWFSGGYVGVDVFFVISGYLITTILIDELDKGSFSITRFYERRAKRILPALLFISALCIPFAWFLLLPEQFKDFSQALISIAIFSSNILFWRKEDYFAQDAEENPLLHTWSLAVEEQFYIFFPVLLLLLWRFGRNPVFLTLVIFSFFSLILSEWASKTHPSANFYLLPTRAWELGAGAICAFILSKGKKYGNNTLSSFGFLLILIPVIIYDENTPFPSFFALPPVIGASLIIIFGNLDGITKRILSTRILVSLGLISYSAYLWHQPIFAFARVQSFEPLPYTTMALLSLASLVLAWLTWKFVETPFRNRKTSYFRTSKQVLLVSACSMLIVIAFGSYGSLTNGASFRSVGLDALSYEPDNRALQKQSWDILKQITGDESYSVENNKSDEESWFYGNTTQHKILLVGNSHSKDLFNVLYNSEYVRDQISISRYGVQIRYLADPTHKFYRSKNLENSDIVLISSRYSEEDIDKLKTVIENLKQKNKIVAVSNNIFEFKQFNGYRNLADYVLWKAERSTDLEDAPSLVTNRVNAKHFEHYKMGENSPRAEKANQRIKELAQGNQFLILDRMDYVCDENQKKCFALDENYNKFFYDYGHHTLSGAEFFGRRISKISWLEQLLKPQNNLVSKTEHYP